MRNLFPVVILFCFLLPSDLKADFSLGLDSAWTFRQMHEPVEWMPATVPGTVHTDLLALGMIPDPFLKTNENDVQWVENATWEYQTTFKLDNKLRKEKHIELQFDGIDTYADVYLNDSLLFTAEDMFLSYVTDIKRYVKASNVLRIVFHPAAELIEKNKALSLIKNYPGGDRVFIRKAQYQFGWDWGPRLVTCGLWKPVRVVGWSDFRLSDVVYTVDYLEQDTAYMKVDFMFQSDRATSYTFHINDGTEINYSGKYKHAGKSNDHLQFTFKVPHPKLWWCNGLGAPDMYTFTLSVQRKKKQKSITTKTGIRKIELSSDRIDGAGTFHFILNDVPVFAQGANWIPSDNFLPRVEKSKISNQLADMHSLNMNMVRVWGGGIYESDYFYEQCDAMGLLVWQDLPFACSMYPYHTLDRGNLLMMEVADNQRRVASHPCLALWCGDNENKEGWFNWGWQKQFNYSPSDSALIYNEYMDYQKKFMAVLNETDHFFPYVSSSPQNGWGRKLAYTQGDVHYWGVWWGMEPFASYETHTGRFVSEFGFQGMPSIHTFREMGADVSMWREDSTVIVHQKHPTGYETIGTYMERDYGLLPDSFEDYAYLSQVLQKDALSIAIESQRRNMPTCMGSLFWQYNDCWPVTSWSVEDYNGRKKMAWYELRRLYQPELVTFTESTDSVFAWVTINSRNEGKYQLRVEWTGFDGVKYLTAEKDVPEGNFLSAQVWSCSKSTLDAKLALVKGYLQAKLIAVNENGYQTFATADKLFGKPAEWRLPADEINVAFVRYIKEGPMTLVLKSAGYQRNVMLTCSDPRTSFSENGFNLHPGETVYVQVTTRQTEEQIRSGLQFHTMNKLVNQQRE